MGDWYLQADVGSDSRGRSEGSEDSAHWNYFDASMEGVSLEALESQLLPGSNIGQPHGWNPARHSTSCCTGVERREVEDLRWSSLQRRNEHVRVDFGIVGSSFRSEDSEVLALWEEKSEAGGVDRLGGSWRGKAASTGLGQQKPAGLQSPWRESVSNAVKKIESLSHAVVNNKEKLRTSWARSSPIHSKAGAMLDCSPRQSVEKKAGCRSPWRDFKVMTNSSPMKTTESLLHNSPKARYRHGSPCRRMDRSEFESSSPSPVTAPKLFREAVSCELRLGSLAAARSVDFNLRRQVDEREERSLWRDANEEKAVQMNGNEVELSTERFSILEDLRKPEDGIQACETTTSIPQESPLGATSANPSTSEDVDIPPRTIAAAAERALSRQSTKLSMEAGEGALTSLRSTKVNVEAAERALSRQSMKISLEAMSLSMKRCSAQSLDEAMLNEYASEAGGQQARAGTLISQEAGELKASHRYYQRVTSTERSSRWSSSDGNHLDAIDLIAPSAARFLEDEGCVSPAAMAPIKTQGAVPFNWEKEPGKPKKDSESATNPFQSALQLPPRLAVSQHASSPNRYINMAMSAPLAELYALPTPEYSSSSEAQKLQLHRARTTLERTVQDSCPPPSQRGPGSRVAMESPMTKSRSVGEIRTALQSLSRVPVGDAGIGDAVGHAGDQGKAQSQCTANAPPATQPNHQKPAHLSGNVRPTSPTSILCGPGDGSRPSSNPSLSSECEAPLISATIASSLSHCSSPARASFDSMEHSIEHDSEMMSPESNLTSPLRANTRCNSMSYNDSDLARKFRTERQEGSAHSVNAFVKFCKNGKRWMKSKAHSKLRTIHSPEVWAPGSAIRQHQRDGIQDSDAQLGDLYSTAGRFLHANPSMKEQRTISSSDFSARLEGKTTPLRSISKIDHSNVQTDCRFAPMTSALPHEDFGNRSPAYAATLELLSPLQEFSSKKNTKNLQMRPSARTTRKTTRRMRVRVRVRARFLVPMRRALRKLFSRCAFRRRRSIKVKAAESKLLYHVDYTLSPADFRFCKPN